MPVIHMHPVNRFVLFAPIALFSIVLVNGCGPGGRKLTSADAKAFDNASPELKERWAKAQASIATNDYVGSIVTLRSMLSAGLSKPQIDAVQDALASYDAKLMKAVDHGDPAAQKALETLRSPGATMGR
jgi:hypothetical protein